MILPLPSRLSGSASKPPSLCESICACDRSNNKNAKISAIMTYIQLKQGKISMKHHYESGTLTWHRNKPANNFRHNCRNRRNFISRWILYLFHFSIYFTCSNMRWDWKLRNWRTFCDRWDFTARCSSRPGGLDKESRDFNLTMTVQLLNTTNSTVPRAILRLIGFPRFRRFANSS